MRLIHVLFVVPLLLLAAACGSDQSDVSQPEGSSNQSVTVTDMLERTITFESTPDRIVTVSPTATEILYAIGGTAVGRDSTSEFPVEVETLPTVGGAYTPSFEAIAALNPDLVLIEALTQGHLIDSFTATGANVVAVRATSLDDVVESIEIVGQIIDKRAEGDALATTMTGTVADFRASISGSPSFLVLISDADRNIYAAKPESYPGAVASALGLENLAEGMPDAGPFPGFALISVEQLISLDPDYLFAITPAPPPVPRLSENLPRVPGVSEMSAVKGNRLHELDSGVFLSAPGPRFTDAVSQLVNLVGAD